MSLKHKLLFGALLLLLPVPVFAVKTERWEVKTAGDFLRGKLDRLIVTSTGELKLGYGSKRLGDFAKETWCSVVAPDGTIYFGTGSPADIYAIGKDGQPSKVFETEATAVTALAADAAGNVYAATLAEGKIFKITAGGNKGAEFCRLRSPYVWALAVAKDGALFAATGPDGKLYRITPDAQAEVWYDAEEANLVSLAVDGDGALLAGGGERGLLYRVEGKDKAVVLHEFAEDEIRSLLVSGSDIIIGANKQKVRRPRAPTKRPGSASEFEELTARLASQFGMPAGEKAEPVDKNRETPPESRLGNLLAGAVYRRSATGRVDRWASWENESVHQLVLDGDGRVLAAMAGQGRVYRLPAAKQWELLFDLSEHQALTVATRNGRLAFIGTGNIGAGYLVESQLAGDGQYTSEVRDAKFLTTWGSLLWRAGGDVSLATRTGSTALPDKTWSAWSEPLRDSAKVASPKGRFIQLRAVLKGGADTRLDTLSLYSQMQNQKPEVSEISFGEKPKPAPEKAEAEKTDEAAPKAKPASTIKKLSWKAGDKDGDALVYRLYYGSDDNLWLPVTPVDKPISKPEFSWDTESVPDGWYRVKVVASDETANPAGETLSDEKISESIRVDNRRPEVVQLAFDAATSEVRGLARDNLSLIRQLEYALDGTEWLPCNPRDGVFDDREEAFALKLALPAGPHTIAIRATDEDGNIGVEKLLIPAR